MSTTKAANLFTITPQALSALIEVETRNYTDIDDPVLQELYDKALIEESNNQPCCWICDDEVSVALTAKGSVFLRSLYASPMPVQVNDGCWEIPKGQS